MARSVHTFIALVIGIPITAAVVIGLGLAALSAAMPAAVGPAPDVVANQRLTDVREAEAKSGPVVR